jgi:hypothetical protein
MLGPLFTIFTQRVGGDILDLTWAWAAYLTVTGLGMLAVGRIGDRVGHHTLSVIGYGLTSFFTFGYLLVETPFELFVVQADLVLHSPFQTQHGTPSTTNIPVTGPKTERCGDTQALDATLHKQLLFVLVA